MVWYSRVCAPAQGVLSFLRHCNTRIRFVVETNEEKFALWTAYAYAPDHQDFKPAPVKMVGTVGTGKATPIPRVEHNEFVPDGGDHITYVASRRDDAMVGLTGRLLWVLQGEGRPLATHSTHAPALPSIRRWAMHAWDRRVACRSLHGLPGR